MNAEAFRRYLMAKVRQAGSQGRLADAMGENPATLSKVISGHCKPTAKVLGYLGIETIYEFVRLPKLPE